MRGELMRTCLVWAERSLLALGNTKRASSRSLIFKALTSHSRVRLGHMCRYRRLLNWKTYKRGVRLDIEWSSLNAVNDICNYIYSYISEEGDALEYMLHWTLTGNPTWAISLQIAPRGTHLNFPFYFRGLQHAPWHLNAHLKTPSDYVLAQDTFAEVEPIKESFTDRQTDRQNILL